MASKKNMKKMRSMKKAQAAMEFLMTYSWAILAVMIVVGGLATFGVFEFQNFLPDRCIIGHPIQCQEHIISVDSENDKNVSVKLSIVNQDSKQIHIRSFSVVSEEDGVLSECSQTYNSTNAGLVVGKGTEQDIECLKYHNQRLPTSICCQR